MVLPESATHVTFVGWLLAQVGSGDCCVEDVAREFHASVTEFTREDWAGGPYSHVPYPPDLVASGKLSTQAQWQAHLREFNISDRGMECLNRAWREYRRYKVEHHEFD